MHTDIFISDPGYTHTDNLRTVSEHHSTGLDVIVHLYLYTFPILCLYLHLFPFTCLYLRPLHILSVPVFCCVCLYLNPILIMCLYLYLFLVRVCNCILFILCL